MKHEMLKLENWLVNIKSFSELIEILGKSFKEHDMYICETFGFEISLLRGSRAQQS